MHIALRESEIFLSALLALPGVRLEVAPAQAMLTEISSYQLSGAIVAVESRAPTGDGDGPRARLAHAQRV